MTPSLSPIDRRRFLGLLSVPALACLLHACGGSSGNADPEPGPIDTGAEGVARSDKPRETVCTCDARVAGDSVAGMAVDMFRLLTADAAEPNLVFSPASIAIALAMTRAGAAAATATEMDAVLHVSEPALLAPSMNALQLGLAERNQQIDVPGSDEPADIVLSVTNSLWGQQGFAFVDAFLDVLATQYGAGMQLVDYRSDPGEARQLINAWVADATDGRIPALLPDGAIDDSSRLTIVNAIFMQAPWLHPFETERTTDLPFTTSSGEVVQTPTMRQTERFNLASTDAWQAIEMPYAGSLLSMIVVLPGPDTPDADAGAAITTLATSANSERVALSLPRFDIDTQLALADTLAALGMPSAFDRDLADFTAMAVPDPDDPEPLFIGAVVHQANITVDEAGTEAAAATAVALAGATSAPSAEPIPFVVDRPFVFAVRDNPTGAILFLGRIGDPTLTR